MVHKSWRGAAEWRNAKLPMYTGSDEACKLYDASVTQLVGWYNDSTLGGLDKTVEKLLQADSNFVMGHVFSVGSNLMSTGVTTRHDKDLLNQVKEMENLANKQSSHLSDREKSHVKAIALVSEGEMKKATLEWESILTDHPTDILALKYATDAYFYLGLQSLNRDCVGSILPKWKPSEPLYGYLYGFYSFGLVETNFYKQSEAMALKGLSINPNDGWSTHGLGHVYEMEGRAEEGISFLSSTVKNWEVCDMLACHNYWHWALYHIEKMEYDAALSILENEIIKRGQSGAMLDYVDVASLLYRLDMEGRDVKKYWKNIYDLTLSHLEDHVLLFNDMHIMMTILGMGENETKNKMLDSLITYIQEEKGSNADVSKHCGLPLMQALIAAKEGRHGDVVDIIYPMRSEFVQIGGSDAQRDILNILLISSALQSSKLSHKSLGKRLLLERQAKKGKCSLETRLQAHLGII